MLSNASVIVDNLSLSIDSEGNIKVQTGGEWKGKVDEFTDLLRELYEDLEERIQNNDKF